MIGSGQAEILDFHRSEGEQQAFLSLLVPVADDRDPESVLAVLVLHIDPTAYLYPFITRWPVPSETAETLIIRRDGNTILYLNELRLEKDAALNLRIRSPFRRSPAWPLKDRRESSRGPIPGETRDRIRPGDPRTRPGS